PDFIDQVRIQESGGESAPYLMIRNVQGLVAAAQIGTLELHIWGSRTDAIERPDRLVFDLDPDAALSFADVREAARDIRDILQSLGLVSFPLLTGGKGVHVIAPIARRHAWPAVQAFAKGLAGKIAAADPSRYVATMSKAQRKGKIFIDWLRNQRGATAIAPYSLRARAGAPIAAPVSWAELARTESAAAYTLDTIGARLSGLKTAPWEGYFSLRQSLTKKALKAFS
ncbi:MAG: non-homologous end-joining DNA ligase, partial [Hyphomonadaceae bacterium]